LTTIFDGVNNLGDLPVTVIREIEAFFVQYNRVEGKKFRVLEKLTPKQAMRLIHA
jgi:inorganic pyrophosphatase